MDSEKLHGLNEDFLNEMADELQQLAGNRQRIALVYEKGRGWCLTDEVDVLQPKMGASVPEYRVITPKEWFRPSLTEAIGALVVTHWRRAQAMMSRRANIPRP